MPLAKSSDFYAKMLNSPDSVRIIVPCWLRCITRDTVGRPDSISTKDLVEKTHQLSISVMI